MKRHLLFPVLFLSLMFAVPAWGAPGGGGKKLSILVYSQVPMGRSQQFAAYDENGAPVQATWALEGTVGTITADGLFSATQPGIGTVTALYNNKSDSANVEVVEGFVLTSDASPVTDMFIFGDRVAYVNTSHGITLLDIKTGEKTVLTGTQVSHGDIRPISMNGEHIAWHGADNNGYLRALSTGQTITFATGLGGPVTIYGDRISFESSGNVCIYDIPSGQTTVIGPGNMPYMWGDKLAYHEGASYDLVIYDLQSSQVTDTVATDGGSLWLWGLQGDKAALVDYRNSPDRVAYYDLTRKTIVVVPLPFPEFALWDPISIHDDKIIYDGRGAGMTFDGSFLYDITTGVTTRISHSYNVTNSGITGNHIILNDFKTGAGYTGDLILYSR